jgi:SAM-dependent methyltransferase
MSQAEHSRVNGQAWSHHAYEAWNRGYGPPQQAAAKIRENPEQVLRHFGKYLGSIQGKTVANLLGSHGRRAVALALLGAKVTVVDISAGNQRYATELAQAAGVQIEYIVSDVLNWSPGERAGSFDAVVMELGILHYFVDLAPLMQLVNHLLKSEGRLILHEFHPIITKCVPREGNQAALTGDYFSAEIIDHPVPYVGVFSKDEVSDFPSCRVRYWTLGEVVTSVASQGLFVEVLEERPHEELTHLPGTFVLVAKKTR